MQEKSVNVVSNLCLRNIALLLQSQVLDPSDELPGRLDLPALGPLPAAVVPVAEPAPPRGLHLVRLAGPQPANHGERPRAGKGGRERENGKGHKNGREKGNVYARYGNVN